MLDCAGDPPCLYDTRGPIANAAAPLQRDLVRESVHVMSSTSLPAPRWPFQDSYRPCEKVSFTWMHWTLQLADICPNFVPRRPGAGLYLNLLLGDGRFTNLLIRRTLQVCLDCQKSRLKLSYHVTLTQASCQLCFECARPLDQVLVIGPDAEITFLDIRRQARGDLDVRSQFRLEPIDRRLLVLTDCHQGVVVTNNRFLEVQ